MPSLIGRSGLPARQFCSMACLSLYANLFRKGDGVVDLTDFEKSALRSCMKPLGECVGEIGWNKPFSAYTEEQVLVLIEVVVTQFQNKMREASPEVPF